MGGKLLREADKVAGDILKDFREILIFIGRLLLVATFVEDGYRMWHQWKEGVKNDNFKYFYEHRLRCPLLISTLIISTFPIISTPFFP